MLISSANGFLDEGEEARSSGGVAREKKIAQDTAFSLLVDRHARLMYRIAFSLLRNTQDAEGAVQEAFLKLYRGKTWQQMNDEKAFLARTVWRIALDRLAKMPEQSIDAVCELFVSNGDSPETNTIRKAQADYLRTLIDGLPETLRQTLILSAIEELNSRELGTLLDIPDKPTPAAASRYFQITLNMKFVQAADQQPATETITTQVAVRDGKPGSSKARMLSQVPTGTGSAMKYIELGTKLDCNDVHAEGDDGIALDFTLETSALMGIARMKGSINDSGVIAGSFYYDWNAHTSIGFLLVSAL